MLIDNRTVGTLMTCSCTKRNLQPKEGNWFIQGHTAGAYMHWAACSVPGERTALVSSASPAPFFLTASPFSTSVLLFGERGQRLQRTAASFQAEQVAQKRQVPGITQSGVEAELPKARDSMEKVSLVTSATSLFSTAGLDLIMGRVACSSVGFRDTG